MNFVVFRDKTAFSLVFLVAAFFFIVSITVGAISSAANSNGDERDTPRTKNSGFSENHLKNVLKPDGSARMSLKEVVNSAENIAASPVFERFKDWVNVNSSSNFAGGEEQLKVGAELAAERERLLKQLIETNPRFALEKSVSPELLERLPAEIAAHTEKRVSARGDLMVYVLEDIDREKQIMTDSRIERAVIIGDARYRAFVYGRRETMTTKLNIPLQGIVIGDSFAVDESPARQINAKNDSNADGEAVAAEIGGEIVRLSSEAALKDFVREQIEWESKIGPTRPPADGAENALASSWTEGAKTVLVIRVDTSDKPGEPLDFYNQPLTIERAQGLFTNSVNPFYVNSSYNKTSLTATVTPVVRLPQTMTYYTTGSNYNVMLTDARTAARAAGFETNNYNLDIVTFSYSSRLGWAGIAAVGAKSNMLNGAFYLPETAHELGHNYGLLHANFWNSTDGTPIGISGNNVEYGDCYDNMGACYNGDLSRHFNVRYKRLLDWLTDANVQTVTADGTYRIYAQDATQQGGVRALKIAKGTTKNYWVEFRQLIGGNAQNGALIRWDYSSQNYRETQLLDMNPQTAASRLPSDEPLAIGQSFYDSANLIKITVVGKNGTSPESLDVKVEFGAGGSTPTCTYSISPGSQSFGASGGAGSVSVTTQSGCAWTASSSQGFAVINSGSSGTGSGTVNYSVASNALSTARSATMTIAGQTFTVQQSAAATGTYTLVASPSTVAAGGTVSVDFTAPVGSAYYDWVGLFRVGTANSQYLNFGYTTGGTSGTFSVVTPTEPGQYEFRYMLNNGFTSVATSNIVNVQSVACTYSLSSTSQDFTPNGGASNVSVATGAGCSWSTSGFPSWVAINSGSSGTGAGTVSFVVQANSSSAARTATMTVAGQNLTINQSGSAPSLFSLGGSVVYGSTPNGQAPKYVSGVSLSSTGSAALSTVTDTSGNYVLSDLLSSGTYTVTASKAGDLNSVNSFDVSRVQQHLVGLTNLTPNQILAADVDGNGAVTSLDASRLQQYLVGFPSQNSIGRWRFTPASRQYNGMTGSLSNQNYEAVLVGEVSGNWTPPTGFSAVESAEEEELLPANSYVTDFEERQAALIAEQSKQPPADQTKAERFDVSTIPSEANESAAAAGSVALSLPTNAGAAAGATVTIPVTIGAIPAGSPIESFDFSVYYDPAVLQPASVVGSNAGTLSSGCSMLANAPVAGRVIVSGACGMQAIASTTGGTLYNLQFTVVGSANQTSGLAFTSPANNPAPLLNNGDPSAVPASGQFTVLAPTAASVSVSGRAITGAGRGIRNVSVTLTDAAGNQQTVQTTSFGYYRFDNVAAGTTVTITAKARKFRFVQSAIVRTANDSITDADFISQE